LSLVRHDGYINEDYVQNSPIEGSQTYDIVSGSTYATPHIAPTGGELGYLLLDYASDDQIRVGLSRRLGWYRARHPQTPFIWSGDHSNVAVTPVAFRLIAKPSRNVSFVQSRTGHFRSRPRWVGTIGPGPSTKFAVSAVPAGRVSPSTLQKIRCNSETDRKRKP
jgi:hypothetical protein